MYVSSYFTAPSYNSHCVEATNYTPVLPLCARQAATIVLFQCRQKMHAISALYYSVHTANVYTVYAKLAVCIFCKQAHIRETVRSRRRGRRRGRQSPNGTTRAMSLNPVVVLTAVADVVLRASLRHVVGETDVEAVFFSVRQRPFNWPSEAEFAQSPYTIVLSTFASGRRTYPD